MDVWLWFQSADRLWKKGIQVIWDYQKRVAIISSVVTIACQYQAKPLWAHEGRWLVAKYILCSSVEYNTPHCVYLGTHNFLYFLGKRKKSKWIQSMEEVEIPIYSVTDGQACSQHSVAGLKGDQPQ